MELHVSFQLTMAVRKSWNGEWAGEWRNGEGRPVKHYMVQSATTREDVINLRLLLKQSSYFYTFADGWQAEILLEVVTRQQARRRRRNRSFCGYEWMIDSLLHYHEIRNVRQANALRSYLTPHFITKNTSNGKTETNTTTGR